jgi:PleD family two-component response regulator
VSIGLTQIDAGEHLADAMRRADSALYVAKKNGRNQIAFNYNDGADRYSPI